MKSNYSVVMAGEHKQVDQMRKVARAARTLAAALEELAQAMEATTGAGSAKPKEQFDPDELRKVYAGLRSVIASGGAIEAEVANVIAGMGKEQLKAFIRVNELPLDGHAGRGVVQRELVQLLRQGQAISAPVKSVTR